MARSITTCVPAMASLSPSPVMVLMPFWGEAATTSWPPWRRMATVFEPIRPVPPMTTIFMVSSRLKTLTHTFAPSTDSEIEFGTGLVFSKIPSSGRMIRKKAK